VIDVQVSLHDVANRLGLDAKPMQLRGTVLLLGHVDFEMVGKRPPMFVGVTSNRHRVTAVNHNVSSWMT
jgi:hypothetical protein